MAPQGQSRVWGDPEAGVSDSSLGYGWHGSQDTRLWQEGDWIMLDRGYRNTLWFVPAGGGGYRDLYNGRTQLVADAVNGELAVVSHSGLTQVFYDFEGGTPSHLRGQLKTLMSPGGTGAQTQHDGTGNLTRLFWEQDGRSAQMEYTYFVPASGGVLLAAVVRSENGQPVERAGYEYYTGTEEGGGARTLQSVRRELWNPNTGAWDLVGRMQYRYWKPATPDASTNRVKMIFGAAAVSNAQRAGLDIAGMSDAHLLPYSDNYFEYDGEGRVSRQLSRGGQYEQLFSYDVATTAPSSPNEWAVKMDEELPDGTTNTFYSNAVGAGIAKLTKDSEGTLLAASSVEYNSDYKITQIATPSAVQSVTEPAGGGDSLVVNYYANQGLVEKFAYYASTIPGTGAVKNYIQTKSLSEGVSGTAVPQASFNYAANAGNIGETSVTLYPTATRSTYPTGDTGAPLVAAAYSRIYWNDGAGGTSQQVKQETVTYPAVSESQNGTDVATQRETVFSRDGRMVWEKDPRGRITSLQYDVARGYLARRIADADLAQIPDEAVLVPAPEEWVTPSGALHLITDYERDPQGRVVRELGPVHEAALCPDDPASMPTNVRTVGYSVYLDPVREERTAQGYVTGEGVNASWFVLGAVTILRRDGRDAVMDVIQASRDCASGPLAAAEHYPRERWTRWTHHEYSVGGQLVETRVYHRIPASPSGIGFEGEDYNATRFGYDSVGRQNREVSPGGTITRTVLDAQGRVTGRWAGTDDTGATDADPAGGGAAGNNMKLVEALEYDDGNPGGNGNLTQVTRPVDDTSGNNRVVEYSYDFRDRLELTSADDGTRTILTENTYDNLDRITQVETFHTATTSGNRLSRRKTHYDDLNRVYRSETYSVDPSTGAVGNALTGENWYDETGNVVKQTSPGNTAVAKTAYDGIGRTVNTWLVKEGAAPSSSSSGSGSSSSSPSSSSSSSLSSSSSNSSFVYPPSSSSSNSSSSSSSSVSLPAPSAYYNANASSGGLDDLVGSLDFTASGSPGGAAGKCNGGRHCGYMEYFSAGDNAVFNPGTSNGLTILLWFKPSGSTGVLLEKTDEYRVSVVSGGVAFEVATGSGTGWNKSATFTETLNTGLFYQLVVWINPGVEIGITLNAQSPTTDSLSTGQSAYDGSNDLLLGGNLGGSYFDGVLDEIAFFATALGSGQRSVLYNSSDGLFYDGSNWGSCPAASSSSGSSSSYYYPSSSSSGGEFMELSGLSGFAGMVSSFNDVTYDTVIEQTAVDYDGASNVLLRTGWQRLHDATGTGSLNGPLSTDPQPRARRSYEAFWADPIGRPRYTSDYGTNGGAALERPGVPPEPSNLVLVSRVCYAGPGGESNETVAADGTVTRWENDRAGRRIKLIENFTSCVAKGTSPGCDPDHTPADRNRVTEYQYTPDGLLYRLILRNDVTGDQVTEWRYGVTLAESEVASSTLLREKVYPNGDNLEYTYNRQGQTTTATTGNGTEHSYDYDKFGRQTQDRVTTFGSGVDQTVKRLASSYNARGLLETADRKSVV